MKNHIKAFYSFTFFLISVMVYGQEYIPLLQKGNQWNTIECITQEGNTLPFTTFNQLVYRLDEEILINEKKYFKLTLSLDSLQSWQNIGFIREELDTKRVYYLSEDKEILLYDFNMKVGEKVSLSNYDATITKIDSVKIGNKYHCRISFSFFDSWIEGVGQNRSGLIPLYKEESQGTSRTYFIALIRDEKLIYIDRNLLTMFTDIWGVKTPPDLLPEECPEIPDSNEFILLQPDQEKVRIYSDQGIITIETESEKQIHIYTIGGKRIISKTVNEKKSFNLNPGIYIVKAGQETYKVRVI